MQVPYAESVQLVFIFLWSRYVADLLYSHTNIFIVCKEQ